MLGGGLTDRTPPRPLPRAGASTATPSLRRAGAGRGDADVAEFPPAALSFGPSHTRPCSSFSPPSASFPEPPIFFSSPPAPPRRGRTLYAPNVPPVSLKSELSCAIVTSLGISQCLSPGLGSWPGGATTRH